MKSERDGEKRTNKAIFNLCTRDQTVFEFLVRLYILYVLYMLGPHHRRSLLFAVAVTFVSSKYHWIYEHSHKKIIHFSYFFLLSILVHDAFLIQPVGSSTNEMYSMYSFYVSPWCSCSMCVCFFCLSAARSCYSSVVHIPVPFQFRPHFVVVFSVFFFDGRVHYYYYFSRTLNTFPCSY